MEFYSVIKRIAMLFARKWKQLEVISEVSQTQKDKSHLFSIMCGF